LRSHIFSWHGSVHLPFWVSSDTQWQEARMSRNVTPKYRRHPNGQAFVYHRSMATKSHRMFFGKCHSLVSVHPQRIARLIRDWHG